MEWATEEEGRRRRGADGGEDASRRVRVAVALALLLWWLEAFRASKVSRYYPILRSKRAITHMTISRCLNQSIMQDMPGARTTEQEGSQPLEELIAGRSMTREQSRWSSSKKDQCYTNVLLPIKG